MNDLEGFDDLMRQQPVCYTEEEVKLAKLAWRAAIRYRPDSFVDIPADVMAEAAHISVDVLDRKGKKIMMLRAHLPPRKSRADKTRE